ncbi:tannase and feruloyl esterase [Apiospora marii]|uniref:tannase and feruloyl esterase n=1 Tax=Apiospora marii TaxID=335849 RepID=UPI00312F8F57
MGYDIRCISGYETTPPDRCAASFDPRRLAGEEFVCGDKVAVAVAAGRTKLKMTDEGTQVGAQVVKAVWESWYADNKTGNDGERTLIWLGPGHQATMGDAAKWLSTTCDFEKENPPKYKSRPLGLLTQWLQCFSRRTHGPSGETTTLTTAGLKRALHASRQGYGSGLGTDNADVSTLRASVASQAARSCGTGRPTRPSLFADADVLPRGRCRGGTTQGRRRLPAALRGARRGPLRARRVRVPPPQGLVDALRAWVEEGKAPEVLPARMMVANSPPLGDDDDDDNRNGGSDLRRILCKYPKRAEYDGKGDIAKTENFRCE